MPLFRSSVALRSFTSRSAIIRQPFATRPFSSTLTARAQGYGDGEGRPKGENPQQQGASNATKHNAEHPGPEPPSEGKGTGAGPTKGGSGKSQEDASAQSGGSRSKEAKETGSSPTGGSVGGKNSSPRESKNGAAPKIHDHQTGDKNTSQKDAAVEQHNKEFEKGHDRAAKADDDKVDSKFWSGELKGPSRRSSTNLFRGHGGKDREP